ncbi:MAG: heavy-metal-associated domain-containing protein [Neisseriaceae bacterium]|nr:heavy-metal-associated domain-containing protein [Neisseriaceae bacterium]
MENITLSVGGMTCCGCASTLKQVLENVAGVVSADVNWAENCAAVSFDPQHTNITTLKQAIENAGFDAE